VHTLIERRPEVAVYYIYTRDADLKYHSAFARAFEQDRDAIAFAETLLDAHPRGVEVWDCDRLVAHLKRDVVGWIMADENLALHASG
jgi:hypothetical protein